MSTDDFRAKKKRTHCCEILLVLRRSSFDIGDESSKCLAIMLCFPRQALCQLQLRVLCSFDCLETSSSIVARWEYLLVECSNGHPAFNISNQLALCQAKFESVLVAACARFNLLQCPDCLELGY